MSRIVLPLAFVASMIAGPAFAFGHGGSPIFTTPIIGEIAHFMGWYIWTLVTLITNVPAESIFLLEREAGKCAAHSWVGATFFGTALAMFATTLVTTVSLIIAALMYRFRDVVRRYNFSPA